MRFLALLLALLVAACASETPDTTDAPDVVEASPDVLPPPRAARILVPVNPATLATLRDAAAAWERACRVHVDLDVDTSNGGRPLPAGAVNLGAITHEVGTLLGLPNVTTWGVMRADAPTAEVTAADCGELGAR